MVLAAGDEVGLDAEPEVGLLADEAAVLVEVVVRELAPQRVVPDVQRRAEAIDVLGHAELIYSALARDGPIALGVRLGERRRRGVFELVRTEMDVVVRQHGSRTLLASAGGEPARPSPATSRRGSAAGRPAHPPPGPRRGTRRRGPPRSPG